MRLRDPLHDHLEDLLVLEDAADKEALDERGLRAAHVAGLDPGLSGLGDVDLDLHVRLLGGLPDDRVDDAVDLRHERPHLGRLAAEDVQVLAVHADDERVVGPGPGQHVEALARNGVRAVSESPDVADLLIRVGDHVALHVLRLGKRVLDRRDGRVVVGIGGEADPDLAGVDVDALVAADGAPDGRRDGLDSGQRPQFAGHLRRDLRHPRVRRSRRRLQADQDGLVLEGGDWRRPDEGENCERGEARNAGGDEHRAGPAHDACERRPVADSRRVHERRLATPARAAREEQQAESRRDDRGHHHRGQDRQRIGEHERFEERPRATAHCGDRHHRQQGDGSCVRQGAPHFLRGLLDDLE